MNPQPPSPKASAQHTFGPWLVLHVPTSAGSAYRIGEAGIDKGCIWIYADGIRKGIDDKLPRAQELSAKAHLAAAAPDLLDAVLTLDTRLRECFELGNQITAAEIYDSFYQEIVADAVRKATEHAA